MRVVIIKTWRVASVTVTINRGGNEWAGHSSRGKRERRKIILLVSVLVSAPRMPVPRGEGAEKSTKGQRKRVEQS